MKISEYLKEKLYFILLAFLTSLITILFLNAVRCNSQVIMVTSCLFWALIAANLVIEYLRRAAYYKNLQETLDALDQKYLIAEIIEEAQFLDGQMLYETLQQVDKSMMEHVNEYKIREQEYKDYIEMWVHEIKTPLAASKLIITNNRNDVTSSIEEEVNKVEDFVEQALFYARSTTLEKDYMIKEMNLQTSVNKVIRKHSKEFIYKKIKLQLDDLDYVVYSDTKWLEFILDQIISNALKYTAEEEGIVHIYTQKQEDNLLLYIEDNGVGIPLRDLQRVFDRGFTGKNGRTNEKATGMGLYLCKLLCEKLYLDLRISSTEGKGTTLCINFPMSTMMLLK